VCVWYMNVCVVCVVMGLLMVVRRVMGCFLLVGVIGVLIIVVSLLVGCFKEAEESEIK